jgi:hypothetical protein
METTTIATISGTSLSVASVPFGQPTPAGFPDHTVAVVNLPALGAEMRGAKQGRPPRGTPR